MDPGRLGFRTCLVGAVKTNPPGLFRVRFKSLGGMNEIKIPLISSPAHHAPECLSASDYPQMGANFFGNMKVSLQWYVQSDHQM